MIKFESLSEVKEFLALDAKRSTALVQLTKLKKALEELPKDNPSLRSFERIETKIDNKLGQLEVASEAVSSYFRKAGGNPLNDAGFDDYCDTETSIIGEIEILRESYHDLLKAKNLLNIVQPKPEVSQKDLVEA